MQFYEYDGLMVNEVTDAESDNRRIMREKAKKLAKKTSLFNSHLQYKAYLFVKDVCDDAVTIGVIMAVPGNMLTLVSEYLRAIEVELKEPVWEEISLSGIQSLLAGAERNGYIDDSDKVLAQFGLGCLTQRHGRSIDYRESILEECDKKTTYAMADKLLAKDAVISELDRIHAGSLSPTAIGHPVHYMIQTDDPDTRERLCFILLHALYANNRIQNKRYCSVVFGPFSDFSTSVYDSLYKSNIGGAIFVRYLDGDDTENDYASCSRYTIKTLCNVMKKYRNKVLTIFCLSRECTKTKEVFREYLGSTSFVTLKEDLVSDEKAKCYLKQIAKDNGIRTDKKLFAKLENGRGYLAPDLRDLFDDWYDKKLKSQIYPQYKEIESVRQETIKAPPKSSAYHELNRMIGLEEAKQVINRALNYHKAQKLFSDKGMITDHPTMHMVFTGNPGTAKTTVARLFSRIMQESGILSKGNLIEVGRSDLVGKYVGWTATNVKKQFEEAKGSVLFIDEAYSLVDDRDGSFGDEAINTIVQEMENHREDVVVIFAGYPDKMEAFLRKNPGLSSRIAYHVPFHDYDTESLCKIALLIAKQKGLWLTEEAQAKLADIFTYARTESDFGNGRYARNIIEKAKMAQATRLLTMDFDAIGSAELSTIQAEDIEILPRITKQEKRCIGFGM